MPFRNDTSLIGFRYDQAAQAEPPIPIRPAKSTLRCQSAAAARAATAGAKVMITLDVQPTSCISALASATTATNTAPSSSPNPAVPILARTRLSSVPVSDPTTKATPKATCITPIPVVVALPHPPASGLLFVLSGTEEHLHPALRSNPRSSDTVDFRRKQDDGHAPTTTSIFTSTSSLSQARTFGSESSGKGVEKEDQDPFPHEKVQSARGFKSVTALVIPPSQIRSSSPTSLCARTHYKLGRGDGLDLEGANNNSISSIPLRSPGLSEARTGTSASPTPRPRTSPSRKYLPPRPLSHVAASAFEPSRKRNSSSDHF